MSAHRYVVTPRGFLREEPEHYGPVAMAVIMIMAGALAALFWYGVIEAVQALRGVLK